MPRRLVQMIWFGGMLARSGRLPQFTQITGTPSAASRWQQALQWCDRRAVGVVVAAEMVDPAAFGAEIVLHVDDDDRGFLRVEAHCAAALNRSVDDAWRGRLRRHVDERRARAPARLPEGAERARKRRRVWVLDVVQGFLQVVPWVGIERVPLAARRALAAIIQNAQASLPAPSKHDRPSRMASK